MLTLTQKAAAGQRKAMNYLYDYAKQKVFYTSYCFIKTPGIADSATIWAFRNIWSEIYLYNIKTEDEFMAHAVQKAISYCKNQISRMEHSAFHISYHKNCPTQVISAVDLPNISNKSADITDIILSLFNDIQRLIFVLHIIGKYDEFQIAKVTNLETDLIRMILETEKESISSILQSLEKYRNLSYSDIIDTFTTHEANVQIPEQVELSISGIIAGIAFQAEKYARKQLVRTIIIIFILFTCIVAGIVVF